MTDSKVIRLKPARPCPICGRPSSQQHHPFCSPHCADIDLNRWFSGGYVIPAGAAEDTAAAEAAGIEDDGEAG